METPNINYFISSYSRILAIPDKRSFTFELHILATDASIRQIIWSQIMISP